ncbi:hypothetical protein SPI_00336 [Niveomyces insectorum RCEF 264]|uniref:Uncharacterized protein n=1 Tax=Niveomyces insectorum RCEF 264 TaxID=1081102 RepID=A0A168A1W6_9HYPO|nr:hypothetical protein SPI_00336 [Niveomyces insectorum RCEF 264]
MAAISPEAITAIHAEEIDFSLDADLHAGNSAGDDYDFDLGGIEGKDADGQADEQSENSLLENGANLPSEMPTAALTNIEMDNDVDEIGYEDEGDNAAALEPPQKAYDIAEEQSTENTETSKHAEDGDEIGYEEVEPTSVTHDDVRAPINDEEHTDPQQAEQGGNNDHIDFEFEVEGDENKGYEHGESGEEDEEEGKRAPEIDDYDHESSMQQRSSVQGTEEDENEEAGETDEEEEDDDEEEEAKLERDENYHRQTAKSDHDESDETGPHYDDEDDENDENDENEEDDFDEDEDSVSPSGSWHAGFDRLQNFYPKSTFDVMVTWGDQVCPLFKAPNDDDPDSFYLEDPEALNYPLSKFLQRIRGSIASWVNGGDEVFIRVDDLGLEFGETTTEALLNQVTFLNLLALHNTLIKNDDSTALKSVHITLGTRPNCLLRLKELVNGAGSGKGLSMFQQAQASLDISSDDSSENEAGTNESSPEDELEDMIEEDEGGALISDTDAVDAADVDMAGSLDDTVGSESALQETVGERIDPPTHSPVHENQEATDNDGAVFGTEQDEIDFTEFTNEEDEGTDGVLLGSVGASDPTMTEAPKEERSLVDHGNELSGDLSADAEIAGHDDELDFLEDIRGTNGNLGEEQNDQEGIRPNPVSGPQTTDNQQQDNDDDFLDLHGDIADNTVSTEALEASGSKETTTNNADSSVDTSATATLDNDEIDYEDGHATGPGFESKDDAQAAVGQHLGQPGAEDAPVAEAVAGAGVDEIDWDDGDKNGALSGKEANLALASSKRTREADEHDDLLDGSPDFKRHRTGNSPL